MTRGHCLAIPFPIPGHIFPLLQFCKLIALRGFAITFVSTQRNHSKLSLDDSWAGLDIRLASIPDELPSDFQFTGLDSFRALLRAFENLKFPFLQLAEKLAASATPAFSFILSDVHLAWTQDVAQQFGLPRVALWTSNLAELCAYFQVPELFSRGYLPIQSQHQTSDPANSIEIAGLPPLQPRDLPSLISRFSHDRSEIIFRYYVDQTSRIGEAKLVLVNSFYELEAATFDAMRELSVTNILPVGPLMLLGQDDGEYQPKNLETHEEDRKCLQWLDDQAAASVVYVAFGSSGGVSGDQLQEFARGLEDCGHPFLWAVNQRSGSAFSEDYLERIKSRSLLVSWAPQASVLAHPAVGCFVSHCGWNSTLESICGGVPMACWPIGTDQPLTCKLLVDKWKMGLRIEKDEATGLSRAEEVERVVKCVMEEKSLRARALEVRDAAMRARVSSSRNLDLALQALSRD